MSEKRTVATFVKDLIEGRKGSADLEDLERRTRESVVDQLLKDADGRRWLRSSELLDEDLARRLIRLNEDFRQRRRDSSLERVVAAVDRDELISQAPAVASGSAAPSLWTRLSGDPDTITDVVRAVIGGTDAAAIESTATHLLLDPLDPYQIGRERRIQIAELIIETEVDSARGVAVEYLATTVPERLEWEIERHAHDRSASVRGFAWMAAFRSNPEIAFDAAVSILGNEIEDNEIRRSALNAAGEALPTDRLIELLSYFVVHPTESLALDAADLLHRRHRNPEIAIAAARSPHEEVREIANHLMDPYRGSPAAGGSRPGAPLREDPLVKLMRQLEDEETEG